MEIDWIEGTIVDKPIRVALPEVKRILAAADWQELDRGGYGYECSAVVGDSGRVFWSLSKPRMGIHISLPSSAIGVLGKDPRGLLTELIEAGMSATRVDFAFDDKDGLLDLEQIGKAARSASYVSRFHKWTHIENNEGGETWSFGSRSSGSYIRTYNKAAEQHVDGHWIRVELELKAERANEAVRYLLSKVGEEDWGACVASWILGLLDFKEPGADANKSRWRTAEWWEAFLEFEKKSRLTIAKSERTVDEARAWVDQQVGPTLFVVCMAFGHDEVLRIIGRGSERLKPKHRAMIKSASDRKPEA